MNNQKPMAVEKRVPEDLKLAVKEIFYSIQGEGPFAGMPATFIRLEGCNLKCGQTWDCDTDYSNGERMSIDDILAEVKKISKSPLVVITGGEPFRQIMLTDLCLAFWEDEKSWTVQIETNGTLLPKKFEHMKNVTHVVCSPKSPYIHYTLDWCLPMTSFKFLVRSVDGEARVVYHNGEELFEIAHQRFKESGVGLRCKLFLQPLDDENAEQNRRCVAELCMEHDLRISLQLHKLLELR